MALRIPNGLGRAEHDWAPSARLADSYSSPMSSFHTAGFAVM